MPSTGSSRCGRAILGGEKPGTKRQDHLPRRRLETPARVADLACCVRGDVLTHCYRERRTSRRLHQHRAGRRSCRGAGGKKRGGQFRHPPWRGRLDYTVAEAEIQRAGRRHDILDIQCYRQYAGHAYPPGNEQIHGLGSRSRVVTMATVIPPGDQPHAQADTMQGGAPGTSTWTWSKAGVVVDTRNNKRDGKAYLSG